MKRLLFILIAIIAVEAVSYGQNNPDDSSPFPFVAQGDVINTPIFRASSIVPLDGFYNPILGVVIVSYDDCLGCVTYRIENQDTGFYERGILSSNNGIDYILVPDVPGTYEVIIRINGNQYLGTINI